MKWAASFNRSAFGRWINSPTGRMFRLLAGLCFLVAGWTFHSHPLGIAALAWSFFPLSAAIFNVCWISLVLGGPFSAAAIRRQQQVG
ncbi:MAG: hypothetical protein R3E52_14775 [Burkholderiaceae bacterium]